MSINYNYLINTGQSRLRKMSFKKINLLQSVTLTNYDKNDKIIPECSTADQFFKAKSKKKQYALNFRGDKKVRDSFLYTSKLGSFYNPEQVSPKFKQLDALTSNTDNSSRGIDIQFKNRSPRRKLNKVNKDQKIKFNLQPPKLMEGSVYNAQLLSNHKKINKQQQRQFFGKKLTDFIILKKIGEGNYCEAFLAIEKQLGFICCLKKMNKQYMKKNKMIIPLIRQIKLHFNLKHQNIVDMFGMFENEESIYLVLEYCTDGDLYKYLKIKRRKGEELELPEIVSIIKQLSKSIQSMHNQYIMHRDIKPQNIFLTMGNVIKIGDLGCSVCYSNSELRNTQCGTPLYLAPQLIGKKQYSQSVDIWAIGVLAYELLTGYSPFSITTAADISKVVEKQIDFEYIDDDVGRDFVMKLLQKNVELRFQIEDVLDHPFLQNQLEQDQETIFN